MRKGFVLTERLFKTEEGKVVREGHPDAAYVYRGVGQKISYEEATELGLLDGSSPATEEQSEDLTELKRADLNKLAAELGIEKPDKIKGGIPKVIEAIEAKRAEKGE